MMRRKSTGQPADYPAHDELCAALASEAAFLAACQGDDPDITALEWLSSLLDEMEEGRWPDEAADSGAAWTALDASHTLLDNLRAAVAQATEEK